VSNRTYLTPEQAAERLSFSPRYFRNVIMKRSLIEGVHWVRAFDGRKMLIIWERVEEELLNIGNVSTANSNENAAIPMAKGGRCYV